LKTWKEVSFDTMFTFEQAKIAAWRASDKKRSRESVQRYLSNESLLHKLVEDIREGIYRPKPIVSRQIFDCKCAKWRTIVMPDFRDQIVHWMIMLQLEPYMSKSFIHHTVAAIPGRGPSLAHATMRHWAKCHKTETRWIVKADIRHFYANINHEMLMGMLSKRIRDKRVLHIIRMIIEQHTEGLPLGYYLSQWLANFYLCEFDHYVKETLGVKHYLRYVDDLFFGVRTKSAALYVVKAIRTVLNKIDLCIKEVGQGAVRIFRWASAKFVDYIGIRTYRDGFQELRKKTYLAIRRLASRIRKKSGASIGQARSLLSRRGFVLHTDSRMFLCEIEQTIHSFGLKRTVSEYEKHHAA